MQQLILKGVPNPKQELFFKSKARHVAYGGARGGGKQTSVCTPILTSKGYKLAKNVTLDDKLIDELGRPINIINIINTEPTKFYRLTFKDGRTVDASHSHLWYVYNGDHGKRDGYTLRVTEQLFNSKSAYYVPLYDPSQSTIGENLPELVDPYILGLVIGDGSISGRNVTVYTCDEYISDYLKNMGFNVYDYESQNTVMCSIKNSIGNEYRVLLNQLKEPLFDISTLNYSTRLSLLQGLMDSDGSIDTAGRATFTQKNEVITDFVVSLVRSLGGLASKSIKVRKAHYIRDYYQEECEYFCVRITYQGLFTPCRLPRKVERCKSDNTYNHRLAITNIELIEEQEGICFETDSELGLYMCGDYVVTHNSWSMRRKFNLLCLRYPGLRCLLLRRTLPELRENHQLPLQQELYGFAKFNSDEKSFTFPNGSRIVLGYCDSESDVFRYQGQEYDVIGFEEATHFTRTQVDFLLTCNRSTREDFKPRAYYTSNPGNIGHSWFKRLFIDRKYEGNEKPEDYEFIQALVYDNTVLMENNPEYIDTLENLPEDQKRAMLYGDWDVFEGQFFSEFDSRYHVCDSFFIPESYRIYRTLDYGLDMTACYWIAQSPDNRFYVIKELYEKDLIVSEASAKILDIEKEILSAYEGKSIEFGIAPPDIWNRQQITGKSAADTFHDNGVDWVEGNNDRINGWLAVKEMLKLDEIKEETTGEKIIRPKLQIFKTCTNLIRTLPTVQHDELKPNDVAKNPHELTHAPDSLRMFCIYWITGGIIKKEAKKTFKIKWTEDMIEDYQNASSYGKQRMVEKYGEINYD